MTIQVYREKESGSLTTNRVPYFIYEDDITKTLSRVDAIVAGENQALIDAGIGVTTYEDTQESNRVWRFVAIYSETRPGKLTLQPVGAGGIQIGFNYQAQAEIIYYSKKTIKSGGELFNLAGGGTKPRKAPSFGGLVGVKGGIGGYGIRATGVQVVPRVTNWIRFVIVGETLTPGFETQIANAMGRVNNAVYRDKEAGTLRFVSCQSTIRSDADTEITFGFDYRPVVQEETLKGPNFDLVIPSHLGHDVFWTYDEEVVVNPSEEPGEPGFVPRVSVLGLQPTYYYIERVFKFIDFAAELGI